MAAGNFVAPTAFAATVTDGVAANIENPVSLCTEVRIRLSGIYTNAILCIGFGILPSINFSSVLNANEHFWLYV